MRWQGREQSKNVEDRRGVKGPAMVGGGGILIIIIGAIIAIVNGQPPQQVAMQVGQQLQEQRAAQALDAGGSSDVIIQQQAEVDEFSRVVLKDTEDVWDRLFPDLVGKAYQKPILVIYDGSVGTQGCGSANSSVGPFYCPADMKVYLDLSFFDELKTKFKAPGDFACAYVIAHEIGHHVQNLLGLNAQVERLRRQASEVESNRLSVRMELQADFLAGVWAHHAQKMKQVLEEGDLLEALKAAQQIGDDTLMKQATGRVVNDAFTHGSAEQRMRWFSLGVQSGNLDQMQLAFELPYGEL